MQVLEKQGAQNTEDFMDTHWLNAYGSNQELWNHEWVTHGTCFSTLDPQCLPKGSPQGAEAVSYFQTVVKLFQASTPHSACTAEFSKSNGVTSNVDV